MEQPKQLNYFHAFKAVEKTYTMVTDVHARVFCGEYFDHKRQSKKTQTSQKKNTVNVMWNELV